MSNTKTIKPVVLHAHEINKRPDESFPDPGVGGTATWKTLISRPETKTDTFTVGIATCALGEASSCPASSKASGSEIPGHLKLHRHTHAEIYHVTAGRGIITVDGKEHEVGKGSVVFIPGNAEHGIRCIGEEDVKWLYVFAADGFGEVEYRFEEDGPGKASERKRMGEKAKL
jgi:mannose-6-phosphate isomerase-like protein (cupin superfamily)